MLGAGLAFAFQNPFHVIDLRRDECVATGTAGSGKRAGSGAGK
jgi:hypothetical protein